MCAWWNQSNCNLPHMPPPRLHFFHKPLGNRCPSVQHQARAAPFIRVFAHTYEALLGASPPSAPTAPTLLLFQQNCISVRLCWLLHLMSTGAWVTLQVWRATHSVCPTVSWSIWPLASCWLFWILETYGYLYGLITTKQDGWNHTHPLPLCDSPTYSSHSSLVLQ